RDRLAPADLADPQLAEETLAGLDELTRILRIGSVYPFQMA
ncbi:N-succinylarginine dihydrolase, partial [Halomonas elongata]